MTIYTPAQQAEHRKQWVQALRSDDYVQATGKLRDRDAFCCLGVACEISGLGEWDEDNVYLGVGASLPPAVRDWLGLREAEGEHGPHSIFSLTAFNDRGDTFEQIADLIEKEPQGLLQGDDDG